jgi:hypothetical protein
MANRLRESFEDFNLEFESLRDGKTMEFEVNSFIILDRPLIPVYIGNVEEIRGLLRDVNWAPITRLLESFGKRFNEEDILGNPPFSPTLRIYQLMEEFKNRIPTKTEGPKNIIIDK